MSEAVRRFLIENVGSIERLDVLLLLRSEAPRWWAAQTLSAELSMVMDTAQAHLEKLSTCNLLDVRISDSVIYRYRPATTELAEMVEELARVDRRDRATLAALVGEPSAAARPGTSNYTRFADAFRFRKAPLRG